VVDHEIRLKDIGLRIGASTERVIYISSLLFFLIDVVSFGIYSITIFLYHKAKTPMGFFLL